MKTALAIFGGVSVATTIFLIVKFWPFVVFFGLFAIGARWA